MQSSKNFLAYIALIIICIVWGTTYYALRVGVISFPPFLFSAIRQVATGLILISILEITGNLKVSLTQLRTQFFLGILLISFGNGIIGWSERYIPSGLAALIVSILPVYIAIINYLKNIQSGKASPYTILGLILGSIGISLLFKDNFKDFSNTKYLAGMLLAFGACLAWAYGTIYSKQKVPKGHVLTNAALQMLFGGIGIFIMSLILDDYSELKHINPDSLWALGYLIIFGSVIAYTCYVYAIEKLPVGIVSLYAYINPFIALVLGYFLLNETITITTMFSLICVISAIYFINKGYLLQKH
jgi:drug/metabolite transporter (DMT)-like permease